MNEGTGELELVPEHQAALFDTSKPDLVIDKAQGIAKKLTDIIEQSKLYSNISGRRYVRCEGWTTMLAMLGVFPHVEYCKLDEVRAKEGGALVYEAKVVLKTISGQTVGSGEAICSTGEANWAERDEFAIKSMAQTRATGKAARNSFSWIMALAGYEATPAEEMVGDEHTGRARPPVATVAAHKPAAQGNGTDGLYTSKFELSDPITSKKGTVYRKAMDSRQDKFFVWDDKVCAALQVANGAEQTVRVEDRGGFMTIVEAVSPIKSHEAHDAGEDA